MENKTLIICLLGLTLFVEKSFCANRDTAGVRFAIGITGGLSQNTSLSSDLYGRALIPLKPEKLEVNFGYSGFSSKASYRDVKDLQFKSHGLFIEGNYFLTSGLYAGFKAAINLNWVNEASQKLFDKYPNVKTPELFSGKAFYGQIGYYHPLGNIIGIKGQLQVGLHNYKIAEGRYWQFSNSSNDVREAQFGIEKRIGFLYNLSIGMIFNLSR